MAFPVYEIDLIDSFNGDNILDLLSLHKREVSIHIIEAISHAVENCLPEIDIVKIYLPDKIITLSSSKGSFVDSLKQNIENLIEFEEYDVCAKGKKIIDILEKNLDSVM